MKLFKGKVEVKETDTVKVHQDYLTVFDKNGKMIYLENDKYWVKREFDKNGNTTYLINSKKYWEIREFDKNSNEKYYENIHGLIIDKRFKEITIDELTKIEYKLKDNKK